MKAARQKKIFFILVNGFFCLSIFAEEKMAKTFSIAEKSSTAQITPLESLFPMLLGLAGILVIIFVLALLLKKMTGLNIVSNNIKVIESQSLGAKEKLVIVEIQNQQYVLGVTAHSINQICELKNNIQKKPVIMPFDKIMKQFLSTTKSATVSTIKSKTTNQIDERQS